MAWMRRPRIATLLVSAIRRCRPIRRVAWPVVCRPLPTPSARRLEPAVAGVGAAEGGDAEHDSLDREALRTPPAVRGPERGVFARKNGVVRPTGVVDRQVCKHRGLQAETDDVLNVRLILEPEHLVRVP